MSALRCDKLSSMKPTALDLAGHEAAILEHLIEPEEQSLPKGVARYLLSLKFRQDDLDRINVLSAKARQGSLTPHESEQLDSYLRVGHFLSLMKSKARRSLKESRNR